MLRTFWRKLHLTLALIAALFLIIASVTGAILSFEPIEKELHPYHIKDADKITVSEFISMLDSTYSDVDLVEAEIDENGFLKLSVIDEEGEMDAFYINAHSGKKLGKTHKPGTIYDFCRKLHRSLFLGSLGRMTMGVVSAILILIVISGIALIIKRQLGVKRFFSRVTKDSIFQYVHVVLGRLSFPLLIVIAVTGVYLSLDRFGFLPKENKVKHTVDFEALADSPEIPKVDFPVFKKTTLDKVQKIQFPFTPFPEDYYQLRLDDRDIIVNQYTGGIESSQSLGEAKAWNDWMFNLHTGQGSIGWSLVLLFGSLSIFVFIISGFVMTFKRLKKKARNKVKKEDAQVIILIGSESGSTGVFARHVQKVLLKRKVPVYMTAMNNYSTFPKMEHLIVLTSTYGSGEPPSNAIKFIEKFKKLDQDNYFKFSVVAFGSTDYAQFCRFGEDVQNTLHRNGKAEEFLPLVKVNKQADDQRIGWLQNWTKRYGIVLTEDEKKVSIPETRFEVQSNSKPSKATNKHFTIRLSAGHASFRSGDLIAVRPHGENTERFYSIGKMGRRSLLLSIRKHENGVCSSYMSSLSSGDRFSARIQNNASFHFPKEATRVLAIANGTGIAPFLGMASENKGRVPMEILWGMKSSQIKSLYSQTLKDLTESGALENLTTVYSAEPDVEKQYVQDVLPEKKESIIRLLEEGGVILICGSIAMRDAVLSTLNELVSEYSLSVLQNYLDNNQVLSDCY